MKEITLKNGRTIKTPWLRIEEAAAYCGLSRSAFTDHAQNLPHSGSKRTRLYNAKTLDAWLNGVLDIPFDLNRKTKPSPCRSGCKQQPLVGLVHPVSGKIYKTRKV